MNLMPLIERELRVALRKRNPVAARFWMALGCTILALLYILLNGDPVEIGPSLHRWLCLISLLVVYRAPKLVAGLFADERRNDTLGFLFLSGLSAGEIFVSKVISSAMIAFNSLMAMVPLLALPFIIGGLSFDLFLATICGLPNLLLFVMAVTVFASVVSKDEGVALLLSRVMIALIGGTTLLIYLLLSNAGRTPTPGWLWLSPFYCPYQLFTGLKAGTSAFWSSWIFTLTWSLVCLGGAAFELKSLWHRNQEGAHTKIIGNFWQSLCHGSVSYHKKIKCSWMDVNPFVWMAARNRSGTLLGWTAILCVISLWLVFFMLWPKLALNPCSFYFPAAILNSMLVWVIDYSAGKTLSDPRHDGTYELMLTTLLNPSDIIWGELEAVQILFKPVIQATLILNTVMLASGIVLGSWTTITFILYLLTWFLLIFWSWNLGERNCELFLALWIALNSARPAFAAKKARENRPVSILFWICFIVFLPFLIGFGRVIGAQFELLFAFFTICFTGCNSLKWGNDYSPDYMETWESKLSANFRGIVREPIPDPHDPRYKKWVVSERFPWGWQAVEELLRERLTRQLGSKNLSAK
jgi:hypothetical protein